VARADSEAAAAAKTRTDGPPGGVGATPAGMEAPVVTTAVAVEAPALEVASQISESIPETDT